MINAGKIRLIHKAMRLVALPLVVMGLSLLVGASINTVLRPVARHFAGQMQGQLMAVEAVPAGQAALPAQLPARPQTQAQPAREVARVKAEAAAVPTITVASPEPDPVPTVAMDVATPAMMPAASATPAEPARITPALAQSTPRTTRGQVRQASHSQTEYRYFNGRRIRPARTMTMVCTAYSPDERSCGPDASGTTASGLSVWANGMKMVAADTRLLPFGTLVSIPGYYDGQPVPVLDRGGAIKGHRLDLLYPTHERAMQWGRQRLKITIWEYVD